MTQISELDLLYNQLINLTDEISQMIADEEYELANSRLEDKNKLVKKIAMAKKTANLTPAQNEKFHSIEVKMQENEKSVIENLNNLKDEVGIELIKTRKKVKLGSAYEVNSNESNAHLVDISE